MCAILYLPGVLKPACIHLEWFRGLSIFPWSRSPSWLLQNACQMCDGLGCYCFAEIMTLEFFTLLCSRRLSACRPVLLPSAIFLAHPCIGCCSKISLFFFPVCNTFKYKLLVFLYMGWHRKGMCKILWLSNRMFFEVAVFHLRLCISILIHSTLLHFFCLSFGYCTLLVFHGSSVTSNIACWSSGLSCVLLFLVLFLLSLRYKTVQ